MKETLPQPLVMPLNKFLPALFRALSDGGVHYCVLRGYEKFPDYNTGRDVDLLVRASDLPLAIRILRSIPGVRVVGYFARPYVASVFLQGISSPPKARALQIDCDLSLTWKGLAYLPADTVLQNALLHPAGNSTLFVPSPVHEAITSLLASLLIGGFVKEKYFLQVQRTFVRERAEVIAAMLPQFGAKVTTRLVDSVIGGDREKILGCVRALRTSLVLRNLLRAPFHCALAVARHYAKEFEVRYLPGLLVTVCILSPESCDSTTVIETLMPILQFSAVKVEKRSFWPDSSCKCDFSKNDEDSNSNSGARKSSLASMATVGRWLAEEWLSRFQKNFALRLIESDSRDLMTNQKWRRYRVPQWFAWLVGKMLPSPDLWILLDPAVGGIQSSNHEAIPAQLLRQLEACRSFVKTRNRFVILDADKPATRVAEDAYSAIIDFLALRADWLLKDQFPFRSISVSKKRFTQSSD
jgi:hypothetical protein